MFVLSNGSTKKQFATSLAAALLLSGVGATVTGAEPNSNASPSASINQTESTEPAINTASDATLASNGQTDTATETSALTDLQSGVNSSDVLIHAHEIDGRSAATLYVQNIPVLTFIGTEVDSLSNNGESIALAAANASIPLDAEATPAGDILDTDLELDPLLRASNLGKTLDSSNINADDLGVRWNEDNEGYIVTLADEDLISLGARTILPDTTEDMAEDALQVTNRLRRLIGDVEPISEIQGLPEPEPEPIIEAAPQPVAIVASNVGGASWYGPGFDGRLSASGEIFNQYDLTAAHRTLPFGTRVLVTNLYNGRQVTVRINDRGPYAGDRIIDLSAGAAGQIGLIDSGVGTVQIDILGY